MKHRKFGGSTASRTLACPGWHKESEGIPRQNSVFAQIGTALHDCMEEIMLEGVPAESFTGLIVQGVEITPDMVKDKLAPAVKAFDELCDAYQVKYYEPEVECDYAPDIGGYADAVLRGGDTVIVLDWKFGDGILVSPDDSPQAKFYGMAARKESAASDLFEGATKFVAAIIQPTDRGQTLTTWEADLDVLDQFEAQHNRAVKEALSAHPPLQAGDHCAFCPAAPFCPQKTGAALRALQMDAENLDSLAESLELAKELKGWISTVERVAFQQLENGAAVTGWKMVQKRPVARWVDEETVVSKCRRKLGGIKNLYKRVLLTPAQMRKLAKSMDKELDLDELIVKASSGNTLAPETDKRPAVLSSEALQHALAGIK